MFGMSFTEILVIAVIAILFLGPDKLPNAMVQIAKFFKTFKSSINEAKSSIEQEVKIQELKEEAQKYKKSFDETKDEVREKLTFEELDEFKNMKKDIDESIQSIKDDVDITSKPKKSKKKKKEKSEEV